MDDELIRKNPCLLKSVQQVKPKRGSTSPKELAITWADSEKIRTELPDRYEALVDVGRALGMWQGEAFAFGPDDIDWDHEDGPGVHIQYQVAHDGYVRVFDNPKGAPRMIRGTAGSSWARTLPEPSGTTRGSARPSRRHSPTEPGMARP